MHVHQIVPYGLGLGLDKQGCMYTRIVRVSTVFLCTCLTSSALVMQVFRAEMPRDPTRDARIRRNCRMKHEQDTRQLSFSSRSLLRENPGAVLVLSLRLGSALEL